MYITDRYSRHFLKMLLPNFVDMEMKLSLHINDDLQKTVITNVMTLVCHNNVRSIIMNIFWLSFEWNQFEYIG